MGNIIDLNNTIIIQLVNFIVTIVVLNYLLIKPVRQQISTRNSMFSGLASEIESFTSSANERLTAYEAALEQTRNSANSKREEMRAAALVEEQAIIQKAQTDAQAYLAASRLEVAKEAQHATKILLEQVDGFANKALQKILG